MISYHAVQYKPMRYAPSVQVRPGLRLELGQQAAPGSNVTPGTIKAVSALAGLTTLTIAAATVWVGVNTGLNRRGLLGIAGWVVAVSAGIAGLLDLVATTGIVAMPTADMQAAINQAKAQQTTPI
jgi:hypothetical protein